MPPKNTSKKIEEEDVIEEEEEEEEDEEIEESEEENEETESEYETSDSVSIKSSDDENENVKISKKKKSNKKPKNTSDDEEEEENEDEIFEENYEDDAPVINNIYVDKDERISRPQLTIYERVRLLSVRTKQLINGAKPMIKDITNFDPEEIAKKELEYKVIPIKLIRPMPSGKKELWYLDELEIVN